jgi:signal transduction histidine kinase
MTADRAQVEQLLLNLFRNSVEASPGSVTVRVAANAANGWLHLDVADDGPGMSPEQAERAFEPFFTAKPGGTGLGLATIHRVAENHGGSVALETAPGRGATFHFRFPTG